MWHRALLLCIVLGVTLGAALWAAVGAVAPQGQTADPPRAMVQPTGPQSTTAFRVDEATIAGIHRAIEARTLTATSNMGTTLQVENRRERSNLPA